MITLLLRYGVMVIALFYIVRSTYLFVRRRRRQSVVKYVASLFVWIPLMVIAYPHSPFVSSMNIEILIGFTVVFMVLFRILAVLEELEEQMTDFVRDEALREILAKSGQKSSKKLRARQSPSSRH